MLVMSKGKRVDTNRSAAGGGKVVEDLLSEV